MPDIGPCKEEMLIFAKLIQLFSMLKCEVKEEQLTLDWSVCERVELFDPDPT